MSEPLVTGLPGIPAPPPAEGASAASPDQATTEEFALLLACLDAHPPPGEGAEDVARTARAEGEPAETDVTASPDTGGVAPSSPPPVLAAPVAVAASDEGSPLAPAQGEQATDVRSTVESAPLAGASRTAPSEAATAAVPLPEDVPETPPAVVPLAAEEAAVADEQPATPSAARPAPPALAADDPERVSGAPDADTKPTLRSAPWTAEPELATAPGRERRLLPTQHATATPLGEPVETTLVTPAAGAQPAAGPSELPQPLDQQIELTIQRADQALSPARAAAPPVHPEAEQTLTAIPAASDAAAVSATAPPAAEPSPADAAPRRATLPELPETLHATVRMAVREGRTEARITLRPPELGEIQIKLRYEDGAVSATVTGGSEDAVEALVRASSDLRRSLESQGLTLLTLDVGHSGAERREAGPGFGLQTSADLGPGARRSGRETPAEGSSHADAEPDRASGHGPDGSLIDVLA